MGKQPTASLRELTAEVKDAVAGLPDELMAQEPYTAGSVPSLQAQVKVLYSRIKSSILTGTAVNAVPDNIEQVRWAAESLAVIEQPMQLLISTSADYRACRDAKVRFDLRKQWTECFMLIERQTEPCTGALGDFLILADALDNGAEPSEPGIVRPGSRSDRPGDENSAGKVGEAS
jgi:hypothetical protein